MKQTGTRTLTLIAVSALALGLGGLSYARGGMGPGWGGGMMGPGGMSAPMGGPGWAMGGDPTATAEQRLDQLRTHLAITPDQEMAWNAYVDAVREQTGMMVSHREAMRSGTVTPEQRMALHQQGCAQWQKLDQATQGLYAVLTPEQKAQRRQLRPPLISGSPPWAR